MKLYTLFCTPDNVVANIYQLKYLTFIFDVAGALLVCSCVADREKQKIILLLMLVNPAYLHNTFLWGQFDSAFTCLAFASFLAIYKNKYIPGCLLYLLSLNFKFQAIVFLPPLILFIIYQSGMVFKWKKIGITLFILLLSQFIIIIPFIRTGAQGKIVEALFSLFGNFNHIAYYGASIWQLLVTGDAATISDSNRFLNITYKTWGLLMYSAVLVVALFPFLKYFYLRLRKRNFVIPAENLLLIFALSSLVFFYLNTQMHERYSYSAFLFIAGYAAITGRWLLYILFSVLYFLNNELILRATNLYNYESDLFNLKYIAYGFMALIVICVYFLHFHQYVYARISGRRFGSPG